MADGKTGCSSNKCPMHANASKGDCGGGMDETPAKM